MTTTSTPVPQRIALVIPSLAAGGAQRALVDLSNHWAEQQREVSLISLSRQDTDFFPLHPRVRRVGLGLIGDSGHVVSAVWHNWRRVQRLRAALRAASPDSVISFIDQSNVLTLLAARGMGLPVVVAERTDPRHHRIGSLWSRLRRWTYPRAAAVVVQTTAVANFIADTIPGCRVQVIPNGVAAPAADQQVPLLREQVVCAVGRLAPEKGFDLLIEGFAIAGGQHPEWRLLIYGDGPERPRLLELAEQRVAGRVEFRGWTAEPANAYAAASIFALPSRYEGFPNALLEAMAGGLPAVSFDCPSGPGEIVRHEVDGLLVSPNDIAGFATALQRLMADESLRQEMGQRAAEVSTRYSAERFLAAWESLIQER